jgi:hypothetical protein
LVLGGGLGVVAGAWLITVVVFVIVFALLARGRYPDRAALDRLATELTQTYAKIEEANREIESARESGAVNSTGASSVQAAGLSEVPKRTPEP